MRQANIQWLDSIARNTTGDGLRGGKFFDGNNKEDKLNIWAGYGPLIKEYVQLLEAKLYFHKTHPAFNGKTRHGIRVNPC